MKPAIMALMEMADEYAQATDELGMEEAQPERERLSQMLFAVLQITDTQRSSSGAGSDETKGGFVTTSKAPEGELPRFSLELEYDMPVATRDDMGDWVRYEDVVRILEIRAAHTPEPAGALEEPQGQKSLTDHGPHGGALAAPPAPEGLQEEVLEAAGLTINSLSADSMRHIITQVWEMLAPFSDTQRSVAAPHAPEPAAETISDAFECAEAALLAPTPPHLRGKRARFEAWIRARIGPIEYGSVLSALTVAAYWNIWCAALESRAAHTPEPEPVGEIVIGEGDTAGWTVVRWREDFKPVVGTKLFVAMGGQS